MDTELTRRSRLSAMLIVAAIVLPVLALAAMLVMQRFVYVHYDTHALTLWLIFDAVILAAGLIMRENESLPRTAKRRTRRMR